MSQMERILFWCACLAPALALVIVFPWKKLFNGTLFKKKEKAPKQENVKNDKIKVEKLKKSKKVVEQPVQEVAKTDDVRTENTEEEEVEAEERPIANRDFAEFLKARRRRITPAPRDFEPQRDYTRFPSPFKDDNNDEDVSDFRRFRRQEKTVSEELETISPELKALIISGALDRKNFDVIGENI